MEHLNISLTQHDATEKPPVHLPNSGGCTHPQLDIKSTNGYETPKDKYSIHSEGATDNELNWFDGRDLNSRGLAKEIETTYAYPSGSLRMVHLLARKHHLRTHG